MNSRNRWSHLFMTIAVLCVVTSMVVGDPPESDPSHYGPLIIGDLPEDLEHANHGSFEGSSPEAVLANNVRQPDDLLSGGFDIPTGGIPSPLFGAEEFDQKLLRFEEFGSAPLEETPQFAIDAAGNVIFETDEDGLLVLDADGLPIPVPAFFLPLPSGVDAQSCPDEQALVDFIAQPLNPMPTRLSNTHAQNQWKTQIESFIGRTCPEMPCEGRPPGEGWSHQRWDEFAPKQYFQTSMTGARNNGGTRDALQGHGYGYGEMEDESGNAIPALDPFGNLIFQIDENGEIVYETDEDGNYICETDEFGNQLFELNALGEPIYEVDEDGLLVLDADGLPIPVPVLIPVPELATNGSEFGPDGLYYNTTGLLGFDGQALGTECRFHPAFPAQVESALWTFDGTFPPKLLKARYGEPVVMRIHNALPIDPAANRGFGLHTISIHEHNGHNPAESDGYLNAFFFPGQFYDYRWPMVVAGHDTINTEATDPRCGSPDGNGGINMIPGDYREIMSTHWFHDHMMDYTAQNVYKGNAAMMNYYSSLDRGNEGLIDEANLRFPSGTALDWGNRDYDVNLVLADKAWDEEGQLWFNPFNFDGFMGDRILTNWQYKPYMDVRARKYRFRILNGSVSRYMKIALVKQDGTPVPFHMICNDGNVMEHAVAFDGTLGTEVGVLPTQSIAERYDIVIDFSNFVEGDVLHFVNLLEHKGGRRPEQAIPLQDVISGAYQAIDAGDQWIDGDPCVGKFLEFRVTSYDGEDLSMNPQDYVVGGKKMIPLRQPLQEEIDNAIHRTFTFGRSSGTDGAPWTMKTDGGAGLTADPRRLSAAPSQGHLEIWHIENGGNGWSHPVHIHFEEGIILSRGGEAPPEWERWARKDVYRIGRMPDSTSSVEIALRFREFAGSYMEHCHNTQHEDHAMLARWDIEHPGQVLLMPTPLPTYEGVEYVDTVALSTFRTGDGFGPQVLGFTGVGGENLGSGDDSGDISGHGPGVGGGPPPGNPFDDDG